MAVWLTRPAAGFFAESRGGGSALDRIADARPDPGETAAGATLRVVPHVGVHEAAGNLLALLGGSVVLDAAYQSTSCSTWNWQLGAVRRIPEE